VKRNIEDSFLKLSLPRKLGMVYITIRIPQLITLVLMEDNFFNNFLMAAMSAFQEKYRSNIKIMLGTHRELFKQHHNTNNRRRIMKKSMLMSIIVFLWVTVISLGVYADDNLQGPSTRDSIIELLGITGSYQLGLQAMGQAMNAFKNGLNNILPKDKKIPDEVWRNVVDEFKNELDNEGFYNLVVPIYEKYLTADDIKEIIAFYKSSVGRKFMGVAPNIMREAGQAGQEWAKKAMQRMIPRIEKRLREMGYSKESPG
jgi:hypothetical protein